MTTRRMRADALRNRERLIQAAKDVFAVGGPHASREAVARQAEVGIGTLYRHFPTRESLYEAVYQREVDHLAERADRLAGAADPVAALRHWLYALVELVATKKGIAAALALSADTTSAISARSSDRLVSAVGLLLGRGADAGALPGDIAPEELLYALVGMCLLRDQPGWQASVLRMADVLVDGLCAHPTAHIETRNDRGS